MDSELDYPRGGVRATVETQAGAIRFLALRRERLPARVHGHWSLILVQVDDARLSWEGRQYTGTLEAYCPLRDVRWACDSRLDTADGTSWNATAHGQLCYQVLVPAIARAIADPGVTRQLLAAQAAWERDLIRGDVRQARTQLEELEARLKTAEEAAREAVEALQPGEDALFLDDYIPGQ